MTPWRYHAPGQSPAAVALVFAQTQFDPPMEPSRVFVAVRSGVDESWFWVGDQEYWITGRDGWWTVEPING